MTPLVAILLAGLLGPASSRPDDIDPDRLLRVIQGLHSGVEDISMVYEGVSRFVGPRGLIEGDIEAMTLKFQGTHAYRRDGSAVLDSYSKNPAGPDSLVQVRMALLGDRLEQWTYQPDFPQAKGLERNKCYDFAIRSAALGLIV